MMPNAVLQFLMLWSIILQSPVTTTFSSHPTSLPECNCVHIKDCAVFTALLLKHPPVSADVFYEMLRQTICGYNSQDILVCCTLTDKHAESAINGEPSWIWNTAPYDDEQTLRQSIAHSSDLETPEEYSTDLIQSIIDFKDPKTSQNSPPVLYENKEKEDRNEYLYEQLKLPDSYRQHELIRTETSDASVEVGVGDGTVEHDAQHKFTHYDIQQSNEQRNRKHILFHYHKQPYNRPIFSTEPSKINSRMPEVRHSVATTTTMMTSSSDISWSTETATTTEEAITIASPKVVDTASNQANNTLRHRISFLNSPNCGISVGTRIIGGIEAQSGQFPWITRLGYINLDNNRVSYRCSGSIISEQYILTAAHCVTNLVPRLKLHHILIGDKGISTSCRNATNSCNSEQIYAIKDAIVHEDYDRPKYANDIALLRILRRGEVRDNYDSICLPVQNNSSLVFEDSMVKTGIVAGWSTKNGGVEITNNPSVRYLRLPFVNTTECAILYAKYSENFKDPIVITPSQLCAQGQPMNDVCRGDSGGPLMDDGSFDLDHANTPYTLLGIVAFGPTICGASNFPGVYTRVSSYVDWIVENINK